MKQYTWQFVARDGDVVERTFHGPCDVADWARTIDEFKGPREHFWVVTLDTRNTLVGYDMMSKGSANGTIVSPREVFRAAVSDPACVAVILIHNHPSGNPSPSREDIELTRRMKESGTILGIEVLDHLIITPMGYVNSLKEGGHL